MTDDLVWGVPPPPKKNWSVGKGRWFRVIAELKARPGEWAQIPGEHVTGVAAQLQKGFLGGATKGQVEATCRQIVGSSPARVHVWARWVGTGDES